MKHSIRNYRNSWALMGTLALLFCFQTSPSALAAGTGTALGGQYADAVDGHPQLRDLLENCDWTPAREWVSRLPKFDSMVKSVSQAHWYLGSLLGREADNLTVCVTQLPLKEIPAADADDLTIIPQNGKQVAIRLNNLIFLSLPLFNSATPEMQALTAVHEFMHSFIPIDAPQRSLKLKSMVGSIASNYAAPMSSEHFALQVKMNGLSLPADLSALAPYRDAFLTVLSDEGSELDKTRAAALLEPLYGLPQSAIRGSALYSYGTEVPPPMSLPTVSLPGAEIAWEFTSRDTDLVMSLFSTLADHLEKAILAGNWVLTNSLIAQGNGTFWNAYLKTPYLDLRTLPAVSDLFSNARQRPIGMPSQAVVGSVRNMTGPGTSSLEAVLIAKAPADLLAKWAESALFTMSADDVVCNYAWAVQPFTGVNTVDAWSFATLIDLPMRLDILKTIGPATGGK